MTYHAIFKDGRWHEISAEQWEKRKAAERKVLDFYNKLLMED